MINSSSIISMPEVEIQFYSSLKLSRKLPYSTGIIDPGDFHHLCLTARAVDLMKPDITQRFDVPLE